MIQKNADPSSEAAHETEAAQQARADAMTDPGAEPQRVPSAEDGDDAGNRPQGRAGRDDGSDASGDHDELGDHGEADDALGDRREAGDRGVLGEVGEGDDAGPAQPSGDGAEPCLRPLGERLEALLFASAQAQPPVRLARVLGVPLEEVKAALDALVASWAAREGAIDLVAISGGYRFLTRPAFQADLQGLARKGKTERLSPAALETLSIVAYRQPIARADIEAVRGVAAGPLLRVLLDRDLIRVSGRSPEPGHPLLYGTTKRFLDHFGLESLKQLPDIRDLLDVS